MNYLNLIFRIVTHEYFMAMYGVLGWQLIQGAWKKNANFGEHAKAVIKAMGWAGVIVIFDDEIVAQFNRFAEIDYSEMPLWGYTIAGFGVDGVLSYFKK